MTIQEAIKSGKWFRRKVWAKEWPTFWYRVKKTHRGRLPRGTFLSHIGIELSMKSKDDMVDDILATDWEVKP